MSDPNSKAGINEMIKIAKERDLAAMIIVHSPNQMEMEMHLNASWSCAWVEPDEGKGMQFRIRCKRVDYPSEAEQLKAMEATTGMVLASLGVMGNWAMAFNQMGKLLSEKLHIEHMEKEEEKTVANFNFETPPGLPAIGPTGRFPQGQLNPDDQGELKSAIGIKDGKIVIEFGTTVKWLALGREEAEELIFRLSALIDKIP